MLAIAEHIASLCAGAEGLRLRPDIPREPNSAPTEVVPPLGVEDAGDAAETLRQVEAWAYEALGITHIPAFWRVLAHQPRLLQATWAKDRTVMGAGELGAPAKACVALAVAMFKQSPYWTAYLGELARRTARLDDAALVELTGAVMHYVSYNTIAHGMRLEPPYTDMTAADFRPE